MSTEYCCGWGGLKWTQPIKVIDLWPLRSGPHFALSEGTCRARLHSCTEWTQYGAESLEPLVRMDSLHLCDADKGVKGRENTVLDTTLHTYVHKVLNECVRVGLHGGKYTISKLNKLFQSNDIPVTTIQSKQ